MIASAASLDVAADNGRVAVAGRGAVVFTLFLDGPVPDDINFIEDTSAQVRTAHKRWATVSIYRRGIPFPDGPTRARAAEVSRRSSSDVDVIVLEGNQLWASAARGIMTGIFLLTPGRVEHKVVSNVDDAIDIVGQSLPADLAELRKTWALFQTWQATIAR